MFGRISISVCLTAAAVALPIGLATTWLIEMHLTDVFAFGVLGTFGIYFAAAIRTIAFEFARCDGGKCQE